MSAATTDADRPARPPRVRSRVEDLVMLAVGVTAAVLVAAGVTDRVAAVLVLIGVLLVPGWLVVDVLGVIEPFARYLVSVVLSGALSAAACLVMVLTAWWHPVLLGSSLLVASVVLVALRSFGGGGSLARRSG